MFRLMLKTLWARRKRNGWLLAELILVALLSWAIFDPVIVVTHDRMLPLGYDADRLCLVSMDALQPSAPGYDSVSAGQDALMDSYLHIIDRVRQYNDVEQATALTGFSYPGSQGSSISTFRAEGDTSQNQRNVFLVEFLPHTHFFETYGFRPGKGLTPAELSDYHYTYDGKNLVIDENTLELLFHTDDPRRKRFWNYDEKDTSYIDIVGSIGSVKFYSNQRPVPIAFRPAEKAALAKHVPGQAYILIRIKEGVSMDRFLHDFKPWMLQNLRAGNLYARDLMTYEQNIAESEAWNSTPIYRRNLLVAVFFLVNLCLGVVGTFWLQTRTRREEVGVMLSFGATPGRIVRLLLGEGAVLTTLGTLVGCFIYLQYAISEGLSRGVSYYEGLPPEYWTGFFWAHFFIVSLIVYAILLLVVSTGVYIPARKISRIPPTEALRDE